MKNISFAMLLVLCMLSACIGTDIVEELIVPEEISVVTSVDSLAIGDTFQFAADFFDSLGNRQDVAVQWTSSNPQIISVSNSGLAEGVSEGSAYISAVYSQVVDSVKVVAGDRTSENEMIRTGNFQGRSDYTVLGGFALEDAGDELTLTFDDSFRASNGPGLFVFLSNSISSASGGVEVGSLQSNSGTQTYRIDKNMAELQTYRYVLIYCKPFGLTFGFGELSN